MLWHILTSHNDIENGIVGDETNMSTRIVFFRETFCRRLCFLIKIKIKEKSKLFFFITKKNRVQK